MYIVYNVSTNFNPLLWTCHRITVCAQNRDLLAWPTMWMNDNITIYKLGLCSILSSKHCCDVISEDWCNFASCDHIFEEHGNWIGWMDLLYSSKVSFSFHFSYSVIGTDVWAYIFNGTQHFLCNVLPVWNIVRMPSMLLNYLIELQYVELWVRTASFVTCQGVEDGITWERQTSVNFRRQRCWKDRLDWSWEVKTVKLVFLNNRYIMV